jgi:hypothetical protein
MNSTPNQTDSLVWSYLDLRKAIGIIGICLPFVLAFGKIILESPGIQSSISSYYYTVMRDVFVGSLCAIGVFLLSYQGYEREDAIAGRLACLFALCTAFFPTAPDVNASAQQVIIGTVHLVSAALFFLTLAFFALILFRKTDPNKTPTRKKRQRNVVYTVCGYTIIACIAVITLLKFLPDGSAIQELTPIFWLESIAIVAFGMSWFVKGEAILKDERIAIASSLQRK